LNKGPAITGFKAQISPGNLGFQISSPECQPNLGAGANCTVTLTFTPAFPKRRIATLIVSDDSNPSAGAVKLIGSGIPVSPPVITPSSLTFGAVPVGQQSDKKVKVTNPNKVALLIQSIAAKSAVGAFTQSNNCGSSIAPGNDAIACDAISMLGAAKPFP